MGSLARDWSWAQAHAAVLMTAAGAVLTLLVLAAVWLAVARGSLARCLRAVAIPLVLLWEAQGLYGVALRVHVPRSLAWVLAGVTAAVVLTFAAYAHDHHRRHGTLGPNGRLMWYVAVPMGIVVAANSSSAAGVGLRLVLPLLSVMAFRAAYVPDEPAGVGAKQGSWRLTPRRLGVALGLLDPADTDLTAIHAERAVRLLTRHAAGYHRGPKPLRGWHGWRFERLALMADDEMIGEAARRVRRVHEGLASTAPGSVADAIADSSADAIAGRSGDDSAGIIADASAGTSGDDSGHAIAPRPPGAVARVRRKGAGNASDDEIRDAIRELRADDRAVTAYKVIRELKGGRGTIGDRRAGRLLAEVQAERPGLRAVPE